VLGGTDTTLVAPLYAKACESGVPISCDRLGQMYRAGLQVEGAPERAVKLFQKACDGRSTEGCLDLAMSSQPISSSEPLPCNAAKPCSTLLVSFRDVCAAGNTSACAALPSMYRVTMLGCDSGQGQDCMALIPAYSDACQRGDGRACLLLGDMHRSGRGVARDERKMELLFAKACKEGERVGCRPARQP
jgi:TPR repeat protein